MHMSKQTRAILAAAAIAVVLSLGLLVERGKAPMNKFKTEFFDTFDTIVVFTAFAKNEAEFRRYADTVRDEMNRLHRLFDIYNSYEGVSNIKTVNDAAGVSPVKADPAILDLLEMAKEAYVETDGAVNVALGPILSIWHNYRERALSGGGQAAPNPEELRAAAVHISADDIDIDRENSTVFLRYSDMRLDVGAIAKGFAVKRAIERAIETGLRSGIINAGGNVAVIGRPLDGRETWNVGVRAPEDGKTQEIMDVVYLSDGSAVTSGNYQRYFTVGNKIYHHIIDPETLYPAERTRAVTVLHPDSAVGDMLSTAAFILPLDEARTLIAKYGAEAIWITPDGATMATPGYLRVSRLGRSADAREDGVETR
jgi:thiamine biosynthesis lipoprotein